eukprot:TRINITY_DN3304_c0_g1_i4.p1 TRINITY_DN3304_c0_g1~~TRINITY_DN3304_c0_g1_i4.p1  ORF type:complete len:61 (-),score=4.10 TRINITY_DN3304_c0_g1_i4:25-207(-)
MKNNLYHRQVCKVARTNSRGRIRQNIDCSKQFSSKKYMILGDFELKNSKISLPPAEAQPP